MIADSDEICKVPVALHQPASTSVLRPTLHKLRQDFRPVCCSFRLCPTFILDLRGQFSGRPVKGRSCLSAGAIAIGLCKYHSQSSSVCRPRPQTDETCSPLGSTVRDPIRLEEGKSFCGSRLVRPRLSSLQRQNVSYDPASVDAGSP